MSSKIEDRLANAYLRGFRCAVGGQPYGANTGGGKGGKRWSAFNQGWCHGSRSLKRARNLAKKKAQEIVES